MTEALLETTAANARKNGRMWLVDVAVPGGGNTGKYAPEVLQEYGPVAFPAKTKAYFKHAKPQDRDPRDQMGTYPQGTFWNAQEGILQAHLKPFPRWEKVVEEMAESGDLEVSMSAWDWDKDDQDNITRIGYHRANSIDAVGTAGLEGSKVRGPIFESLVAEARAGYTEKPAAESGTGSKENNMEIEQVAAEVASVKALVETLTGTLEQKQKDEAQASVDAAALAEAASVAVTAYSGRVAEIEAAREKLLPIQVESLMESAKTGDVTALIESAVKVHEQAKSALQESEFGGRTLGSGANEDWTVAGVSV